jgi:WD40 repeat protein
MTDLFFTLLQVWDMASGTCVHTLRGHNDEILDVSFNTTGTSSFLPDPAGYHAHSTFL